MVWLVDMLKLIKTTVLDVSAASVTIDNIPQQFKTLKILASYKHDNSSGTWTAAYVQLNGSTSGHTARRLVGNGGTVASDTDSIAGAGARIEVPRNGATSVFSNTEVTIPNYTGSANKAFMVDSVSENNGTTAYIDMDAALLSSTAAVTSVTFFADSVSGPIPAGSTFYLYGIG